MPARPGSSDNKKPRGPNTLHNRVELAARRWMVDEAAHQKDKRHTGLFSRLMQGKYCGLLGTLKKRARKSSAGDSERAACRVGRSYIPV